MYAILTNKADSVDSGGSVFYTYDIMQDEETVLWPGLTYSGSPDGFDAAALDIMTRLTAQADANSQIQVGYTVEAPQELTDQMSQVQQRIHDLQPSPPIRIGPEEQVVGG